MGFVSQVWRSWKSAKSVALLATVALAIGIGSTTAIYTVIDAVLLKPLPYEHGDRWVALFGARLNESGVNGLSYPDLLKFQQRSHSFDVFGWYSLLAPFNLTSPGQPQFINGVEVTPYLVNNLGVRPALGRWFHEVTQEPNGPYVAVISHALWSRLGSDPSIIGKAITLNDRQYTVTGVMPPWFRLPIAGVSGEETADDVWVPIDPRGKENNERGVYLGYARLRPNVTLPQAEAEIKGIAAQIAREDPGNHPSYTAVLFSLRDAVVRDIRPTLLLLFGAAALLLLITCANVAGLLVARSISRARETAVRVALGAARRQLALQYFLEGLLVSLGGAALGILLSIALVRTFVSLAAQFIPRADEINVNWSVLLFALVVGCLASLLASQAPLWQALRTTPNEVLNEGVRASAGARSRRLAHVLVIAEITLAFTLLSVSALLITQLTTLLHTWPGFDTGHLLTFQLTASGTKYSGSGRTIAYQNRLLEALNAIPGVTSTALVNQMALVGCCFVSRLYPEGRTLSPRVSREISILTVSPRYFETMRIPLRRGRYLNEHDTSEKLIPIVINQAAASYYWPDRDTLGAYVRLGDVNGDRAQVVGIVGNV